MKSAHLWSHQLWTLLPSGPHPLNLLQPPGTGGERERENMIYSSIISILFEQVFFFLHQGSLGHEKTTPAIWFLIRINFFLMRPCSEIAPKKSPHLFDLFDITRVRSQMKDWFIAKLKRKVLSNLHHFLLYIVPSPRHFWDLKFAA